MGVDTWESIHACITFVGLPLLEPHEVFTIKCIGLDTIREAAESSETEGAATPVNGAGLGTILRPRLNIKGTQSGRWRG
jgi:hypothetical protein